MVEHLAPLGPPSYYRRLGENRYRPSTRTGGAWQPGEQHMAPVSGIVVHAIEQFLSRAPRDERLQISRLTFEILGMIAAADFDIRVEVLRPGRTIELLEATVVIADRPVVRARAWCLSRQDTRVVAGGEPESMPGADGLVPWVATDVWGGGFIESVEIRPVPGHRPGRAQAWIQTAVELISDEQPSDLARFVGLVDTANGIATRVRPSEWMFPNVDLSLHIYRQPRGHWVGLDTTVVFGPDGVGLTSTTLHDEHGAVGRAEQILTVRPLVRPTD